MDDDAWLAQQFEQNRSHLRGVAFRMLGSTAEADDAVQEAWLRLARSDHAAIDNLGGWLTTVVARVSLDMLRSRSSRREEDGDAPHLAVVGDAARPEDEAVLVDSVGAALLVVLDTLAPAERLAFVLHDTFGVSFEEIGAMLDRSPDAAKQLAHRARRKVRGGDEAVDADPARQRQVVEAFLAASRTGDLDALIAVLHPDIVLRADAAAVAMGSPEEVAGATVRRRRLLGPGPDRHRRDHRRAAGPGLERRRPAQGGVGVRRRGRCRGRDRHGGRPRPPRGDGDQLSSASRRS